MWHVEYGLFVAPIRTESDEEYMWTVWGSLSENMKESTEPQGIHKINDPDSLLHKTKAGENGPLYERRHSSSSHVFYGLLNHNISPI